MMNRNLHSSFQGLLASMLLIAGFFLTSAALAQESNTGYISAREFSDSQGIAYQWFPMQRMLVLTKGSRIMRLVVDRSQAVVDNQVFQLPSPPKIEDGQVMVPARTMIQVFGGSSNQAPPPPLPPTNSRATEPSPPTTVLVDPPPQVQEKDPAQPSADSASEESGAILVTARHSTREDQTRVVLEFDGSVSFTSETPGQNKFKLTVSGCKNLIPTKRSNPVGRDIKAVSYNSGQNRKGLVLSFELPEGGKTPTIETVSNPFRIVLTFSPPPGALVSSSTTQIASGSIPPPKLLSQVASKPAILATTAQTTVPSLASSPAKVVSEPTFDVPLASLSRPIFQGRAVIVDAGHGGVDKGATAEGLPPEKEITLAIAIELHRTLKKLGFNSYLVRSGDTEISPGRRQAIINKAGGDLFISIHVGASADDSQEGAACFWYDPHGISMEVKSGGKLSPQLVFNEWVQNTRFDLARFLAQKVRERLSQHLELRDRGTMGLPLLPLQFLVYPAIIAEVGMLSNPEEGPKIASKSFQEAAARAIANGIVDFFNGIRLNP